MNFDTAIILMILAASGGFLFGSRHAEKMAIKRKRIYFYDSKLKCTCVYNVLPNKMGNKRS